MWLISMICFSISCRFGSHSTKESCFHYVTRSWPNSFYSLRSHIRKTQCTVLDFNRSRSKTIKRVFLANTSLKIKSEIIEVGSQFLIFLFLVNLYSLLLVYNDSLVFIYLFIYFVLLCI